MSCGCGGYRSGRCGCNHRVQRGMANLIPWRCAGFGDIPPSVCSPPMTPCAEGMSFTKKQMLACATEDVSKAYHALATSLIDQSAQTTVLTTQKPLLITAMTTYNHAPHDPQETFDRDDAISGIMNAITASIGALSADPNYKTYTKLLAFLQGSVSEYFSIASSAC